MPLTPAFIRGDKKCGASGIADNKKCKVGTSSTGSKEGPTLQQRVQGAWAGLNAITSGVLAAQNIGIAVKNRSLGHAVGALGNIGGAVLSTKAASEYNKGRGISGNLYSFGGIGSIAAGTLAGNAIAERDFRSRQSNSVVNKKYEGPDPYSSLGLSKNATMREVRTAYMKNAAKHHPDRGGDPAKFRAAKEAYEEVLRRNKGRRDSVWATGFEL